MKNIFLLGVAFLAAPATAQVQVVTDLPPINQATFGVVSEATPVVQARITRGPWTLVQGPASNSIPYNGFCVNGVRQSNPGTNLMQPYYFPFVLRTGSYLQGYFDYRPRNADEQVVAAVSRDGGATWTFQQSGLQLSGACPADPTNPDNPTQAVGDNGQGHPAVLIVNGQRFLYTLDRSDGNIDVLQQIVHPLTPTALRPLGTTPAAEPVPSTTVQRTTGLLNPDVIFGQFPGLTTFPGDETPSVTILYAQKQRSADNAGATAYPSAQVCRRTPPGAITANRSANHDIITVRLATTTDGINFTDRGPVTGLGNPRSVDYSETRWISTGSIVPLQDGRFGLVFGGGNCLDGDSDGFHYVGYAESAPGDISSWTVTNGINNPIISTGQVTVINNNNGGSTGTSITVPASTPLVGQAINGTATGFWRGRAYGPSVTYVDANHIRLIFAGYNTPQPSLNLGDYRSIGSTLLTLSSPVAPF